MDLGDGEFLNLERAGGEGEIGENQFRELYVADDQFVVGFPAISPAEDGQVRNVLVKVCFQGRVIDFRTNFVASVFLDTLGAEVERRFTRNGILALGSSESGLDTLALFLPQRVQDNDVVDFAATDQLSDRNSLAVIADISAQSKNLVTNFRVAPNPFTPNGDEVNGRNSRRF